MRTVFLHRQPAGTSGRFLAPCRPQPPNPQCLVCAGGPTRELRLLCHPTSLRLGQLRDEVLMRRLGMVAPEVEIDGKATILISSDEEETKGMLHHQASTFLTPPPHAPDLPAYQHSPLGAFGKSKRAFFVDSLSSAPRFRMPPPSPKIKAAGVLRHRSASSVSRSQIVFIPALRTPNCPGFQNTRPFLCFTLTA